ncbi:MAG TPA: anthranilate phosphoribosyltransferase [Actinobacteria bacterium]|nr:anthranilate phosphoribosyltransferase [Actinomycetota bacterium]
MSSFAWADTLATLSAGESLTRSHARAAMTEIMEGRATAAQIAALIVSLRIKGETVEEMTGLVQAMRDASLAVELDTPDIVDIVGTGGDRSGTFNISTAASLIAAGAGAKVAKHGNRSASSLCGSADVLEALGVVIDLDPDKTAEMFRDIGYAFFLAPVYHPAMRHAGPVRRELGIRTVFNFLGPLCNPAGALNLAVGVSDGSMANRMVNVLADLGTRRAFVFHGHDGLDELSISSPSSIWRLDDDGEISQGEVTPADFGVAPAPLASVLGGTPDENVAILRSVLAGDRGPKRDISVINAAVGLVTAGVADEFAEAADLAARAIDSGAASDVLDRVVARSQDLGAE